MAQPIKDALAKHYGACLVPTSQKRCVHCEGKVMTRQNKYDRDLFSVFLLGYWPILPCSIIQHELFHTPALLRAIVVLGQLVEVHQLLQRADDLAKAAPSGRVGVPALLHDVIVNVSGPGNVGNLLRELQPVAGLDLRDDLFDRHSGVGLLTEREDLPQDDAVAPDVRLHGEASVLEVLYGHPLPWDVVPEPFLVPDVVVERFRKAEVAHLGDVTLVAGNQDVSGSLDEKSQH